jgi:hypothetical protein
MNIMHKLSGALLAASLCVGAAGVHAGTYHLTAITSGNWNSAGTRGATTLYQIGYNAKLPNKQTAFFEFNLTPVKGKTVTDATTLIPGSTDYDIEDYWPTPTANNTTDHFQFKVGIAPQGSDTLSQILTGNNSTTIYLDGGGDAGRNQDLGYGWVMDGLHAGFQFDTFHYNTARLQTEVNAGGDWVFWGCDRFDNAQNGGNAPVNYIWGSTSYNTGIILTITTSN